MEEETTPKQEDEEDEEAPVFTQLLQPITVQDTHKVTLTVQFRGRPQPKITWYHNGHEIAPSTDFEITIDYSRGTSTLIIIEVFPEDEGEYTCIAVNRHGESITTCRISIIGRPLCL